MSIFAPPPKPTNPLAFHRILSPTAAVKVSPICLGGISLGNSWAESFGKNEDAFALLDAFYAEGGNFIDTSNVYCNEDSERLIGEWMEKRGVRDQMVVATKYASHYKAHDKSIRFQANYQGSSAKSMYVSVRDSLKKLKTEYIDVLYVHWWDFGTSVEEVMTHIHSLVMARQVLYLGISDTPAWFVVKANAYARQHGLTPFSVYQGRWNVAERDMEAEIITMCEDQGMGIVPWGALGGGNLLSSEQREKAKTTDGARPTFLPGAKDLKVSEAVEAIANRKGVTFQSILLAYLFSQTTYVIPIVGVQTVEHVKAIPEALKVKLSEEEIHELYEASSFEPLFPMNFLFTFRKDRVWDVRRTTIGDMQQYQMASWIDGPAKQGNSWRGLEALTIDGK